MIGRVLGALQFLTVLPIRRHTAPLAKAMVIFPLVGALLGASAGALIWISSANLGRSMAALLTTAWLMIITGCLHEDGLADVADALRAGRTREKMMAILKDSRIGTYGAIALILSVAIRWQCMAQSAVHPIAGLTTGLTLSRTSMIGLSAIAPSVGTGLGSSFVASCSRTVSAIAMLECIAIIAVCAVFIGWRCAAVMISASVITILLARIYFVRRLGGVNGDCLGATCQSVEIVNLVILAWQPSI